MKNEALQELSHRTQTVRSITTSILCLMLHLASLSSFGQAAPKSIPTFELANRTYYNALLEIRSGDLMVRHSGGIYNQKLRDINYKTLLRIGNVKPALRASAEYQAALARFVPTMRINGRSATGVRLENATNDAASFLTDQGMVSCQWSDLTAADRARFSVEKYRLIQMAAAKIQREQEQLRVANAVASATRARETEIARALAAAREVELKRQQKAAETEQMKRTAQSAVEALTWAVIFYGGYKLLSGSSSPAQIDADEAYRANNRSFTDFENRQKEWARENQKIFEQERRRAGF